MEVSYAGFRLTCRLPHCRFDDDICTTAQAPLAAEGWPSGKQRQANRSITLPLCPPRQIADSWILFNSGAMPLGDKVKAAWPLRAATLKQQAMITRQSGERQASLKPALLRPIQTLIDWQSASWIMIVIRTTSSPFYYEPLIEMIVAQVSYGIS